MAGRISRQVSVYWLWLPVPPKNLSDPVVNSGGHLPRLLWQPEVSRLVRNLLAAEIATHQTTEAPTDES